MQNIQLTHNDYKHEQKKFPIYLVLDNIRDVVNIGSTFRLSDALGVKKIFICGNIEKIDLENKKIKRVSRNTVNYVDYEIKEDIVDCINDLKDNNIKVLALELTNQSVSIQKYKFEKGKSYAFIIGNEQHGVSQAALDIVDASVHIDMFGNNSSMNVSVATGIAVSQCLNKIR